MTGRQYQFLIDGRWKPNPIGNEVVTGIRVRETTDWRAVPLDDGRIPARVLKDCRMRYDE